LWYPFRQFLFRRLLFLRFLPRRLLFLPRRLLFLPRRLLFLPRRFQRPLHLLLQ
jgi:hypothetical protein